MNTVVPERRVSKNSESPLLYFIFEKLANIYSHNQSLNSVIITKLSGVGK